MKKALIAFSVSIAIAVLSLPAATFASIGVGVGTGRIVIDEPIKAGSIYTLPSVTVFNTGTEKATYTMDVTLNEKQDQLKPNPDWFSFSPKEFTLLPQKSQIVIPTFHPPIRTQAGEYFAYLEAHPAQTVQQGNAAIGVAAATKLSFKVEPSNFFLGIFYRFLAIYLLFSPWSYIITGFIVIILIILLLKRYLRFNIHVSKIKEE
jgi:hypothetical protein